MKRFFISAIVTMSCFMANAQTISIPAVNIAPGGEKTVSVSLEGAADYTAFQFDIALPTGVTVKSVGMDNKPDTRKIETGTVGDKFRVLSYDEGNAKFTSGSVLSMTFKAADNAAAEENEADVTTIVVVKDDGTGPEEASGSVAINVIDKENISITSDLEKTTFVSNYGLDFTGNDLKAFVVTGREGNALWMTRVYKVPAGTAIVVKGSKGNHTVNIADVKGVYYTNFLVGNNTDQKISVTPESGYQYYFFGATNGFTPFTEAHDIGAHKAYIRVKELPAAVAGSSVPITINDKTTSLCANVDLDFTGRTDDVKAYVATGYDGSVWLTPVQTASAGTPLYIKGSAGNYTIPSTSTQTVYANMMKGNNSDAGITISATDGEYTNFFVSSNGFKGFTEDRSVGAHKSYLQVLTSYLPATSRGISDNNIVIGETEVETLTISLGSLGENDDETTGIRSIDSQLTNDIWYNLKGQRIDSPTKKGLYIKNGKKVVVK